MQVKPEIDGRMKALKTLLTTTLFSIALFTTTVADAQVQWIDNASFTNTRYTSLYDMLEDGKPVVIAIGNVHSQSSEQLLAASTLQKLNQDHGDGTFGGRFSSKDLKVAFVNVQVLEAEQNEQLPGGLQFINFHEGDETFNKAGWDAMYSISATRLFLITPDRLVRPLTGKQVDEIYAEVKFYNSKLRPSSQPDIRLLEANMAANGKAAVVRVQNFSTKPVHCLEVNVLKDGQVISTAVYTNGISTLEDAVVSVPIMEAEGANLSIIAKAEGDTDPLNNRWAGALRSSVDASMVAGDFAK